MLLKMATNISGIPVVDFSAMSLQNDSSMRENSDAVKQLADHVHQAFSTIGFVYLKNHGIPQEKVAGSSTVICNYTCLTRIITDHCTVLKPNR